MAQPDIDFCGVGLPDDLDSQLRSVCHDVVESMGRTKSFGFLQSDPDFDTMTERVCEKVFAGPTAGATSAAAARKSKTMAQKLSQDRKVCPVVKSALLQQQLYQAPAIRHEHCASSVPQAARDRAQPRRQHEAMSTAEDTRLTEELLRRNLKAAADAASSREKGDLPKPEMSVETLRLAGYDAKTSSGIDSLTNRLSSQPKLPQFPPTWLVAQHAERSKSQPPKSATNYDDEAQKLFARLNIDPAKEHSGRYNALDAIFCNPDTGATIYVGNETASKDLSILEGSKIMHIVNCTDSMPNHLEGSSVKDTPLSYLRWNIVSHRDFPTEHQIVDFVKPMLEFISDAMSRGENVMVHCLAGAHRAGTTGIICLMCFAKLSAKEATFMAKQCRPIIDPIGDFPALLGRLERGWAKTL